MRKLASCSLVGLLCCTLAQAQSFNLDCGTEFGPPDSEYGAAAGQGGFWNVMAGQTTDPVPLIDINGEETSVTFTAGLPVGPAAFDDPNTVGDDGALLDDYFSLHSSPNTFDIAGLAPGDYTVFVYAWAPDSPLFLTGVSINGSEGEVVGGPWHGHFEQGVTHARETVAVSGDGTISIFMRGIFQGTLNGLQVVFEGPPCAGDVDGDRTIDLTDLAALLAHFGLNQGAARGDGDLDGDGDVDLGDLAVLLVNFGATCS